MRSLIIALVLSGCAHEPARVAPVTVRPKPFLKCKVTVGPWLDGKTYRCRMYDPVSRTYYGKATVYKTSGQ